MNNQLIGQFIRQKRKEKGLTQKELASKLNITDRAISKWERGICCPDISLLKELSSILDITINELLSGHEIEILKKEETDNTLLNSVQNYTKLEKKKTIKAIIILILLTLLSLIIYITYNQVNKTDNISWDTLENMMISNKFFTALEHYDYNTFLKLTLEVDEDFDTQQLEEICLKETQQKISKELIEPRSNFCLLKELENEGIKFLSHKYMTQFYVGNGNFEVQYEIKVKYLDEVIILYINTNVHNGVLTHSGAGYPEDKNYINFRNKYTTKLHKIHMFFLGEDWMDKAYR